MAKEVKKAAAKKEVKKAEPKKAEPKKVEKKPAAKPAKAKEEPKKPAGRKAYHVVKRPDNKWEVFIAGKDKAIKLFATQKEAIAYTETMAENQDAVFHVHASKGASKGRIIKK